MKSHLRVFVYGTLKRGGRFHDQFCRGAVAIERASVHGRLHMLPAGYPTLEVPPAAILAEGTDDPAADVETQERFVAEAATAHDDGKGRGIYGEIIGELMAFDDADDRLPRIDELEDFSPRGPSLYCRVLLRVRREKGDVVTAWVYVGTPP